MVYFCFDKESIKKDKLLEMERKAKQEFGNDTETYLFDDGIDFVIDDIDTDTHRICFHAESELGYVSGDVVLTTDNLIEILQIAIKQFNKLKTALEVTK